MRLWDATARRALRAAVVVPAVFALGDKVIANPDLATFASIGSVATLLLADFGGPVRRRLEAYAGLALSGGILVTLGTLASRTTWLAVAFAALASGAVLFAGVLSAYVARAATASLLLLVLPLTIPGPDSSIAPRLEGWALAVAVSVVAVLGVARERSPAGLGTAAASALRELAATVDASLAGVPVPEVGHDGATSLRRAYLSTPYRPTGVSAAEQALVELVAEIAWLDSLVGGHEDLPSDGYARAATEDRALVAASAAALLAAAAALERAEQDGDRWRPEPGALASTTAALGADLADLATARAVAASAAASRVASPTGRPEHDLLECAFHARAVATASAVAASSALVASGGATEDEARAERARWYGAAPPPRTGIGALARETLAQANLRSVWLRNSLRGASGFALAVLVARVTNVQHGFWVALATLGVLRSNLLGTGATAFRALVGTTLGFVAGGALLLGLGNHVDLLWAVFPVAVLLAGYAPLRISFLAGQAAFTVLLAVLFNIVEPAGWRVGLVRIEDVAIGCGISLVVGFLLWPRGARPVVATDLADAYRTGVEYLSAAVHDLLDHHDALAPEVAAGRAAAAFHRLDVAFRAYLAEQGTKLAHRDELAALVSGAGRLLLTANSLASLPVRDPARPASDDAALDRELHVLDRDLLEVADVLSPRRPTSAGARAAGSGGRPARQPGTQEQGAGTPARPDAPPAGRRGVPSVATPGSPPAGSSELAAGIGVTTGPDGELASACTRWVHHHLVHLLADVEPLAAAASAISSTRTRFLG